MTTKLNLQIIDDAGVEQALLMDFDITSYGNVFPTMMKELKLAFVKAFELVEPLLKTPQLKVVVMLEQAQKGDSFFALASYDSERSDFDVAYFHVYYDTILDLTEKVTSNPDCHITETEYFSTVVHELVHAADCMNISETNKLREKDIENGKISQNTFELLKGNAPLYDVLWYVLSFLSKFRSEGVAILGENLLRGKSFFIFGSNLSNDDSQSYYNRIPELEFEDNPVETYVFFGQLLNDILKNASDLPFHERFEVEKSWLFQKQKSNFAYKFGEKLLFWLLLEANPELLLRVDDLEKENSLQSFDAKFQAFAYEILQLALEFDLSDFVNGLLALNQKHDGQLFDGHAFFGLCSIIQDNAYQPIENNFIKIVNDIFSSSINNDEEKFLSLVNEICGYPMTIDEIESAFSAFDWDGEYQDIFPEIKSFASYLLPVAKSGNEIAIWALTYLFDDEDLINDNITIFGYQDDYIVLRSAVQLLYNQGIGFN